MDGAIDLAHRRVEPDLHVFTSHLPIPTEGVLPVNAFLLRAKEPVLVDTGLQAWGASFVAALRAATPLDELRWIWITHADPDHTGGLARVLAAAPRARVVTSFLGMGKLALLGLPVDRVLLLNPSQALDVGDRRLVAFRPPSFDAPETTGFIDVRTRTMFSSDCFGALLSEPADDARLLPEDERRRGIVTWATVDAPWLENVDLEYFRAALDDVRDLDPALVLSAHLPPARGMIDALVDDLACAAGAAPYVGPDQQALLRMMRQAAPAS